MELIICYGEHQMMKHLCSDHAHDDIMYHLRKTGINSLVRTLYMQCILWDYLLLVTVITLPTKSVIVVPSVSTGLLRRKVLITLGTRSFFHPITIGRASISVLTGTQFVVLKINHSQLQWYITQIDEHFHEWK